MAVAGRRKGVQSILVEPYRQVRLGLLFVVLNVLFSLIVLSVFGYYVNDIFQSITHYFELSGQDSVITYSKLTVPIVVASVLLVLFIALTIFISVKYTHKIYGPLVSINRFLDEVLEGKKPQPIQLRDGDQLQDLAEKLNRMIDMFNRNANK